MAASSLNKIPLSRRTRGCPWCHLLSLKSTSALLRGNGCSGLLIALKSLCAGSLPVKAPGWMPGRAVNSDYNGAGIDVKERIGD